MRYERCFILSACLAGALGVSLAAQSPVLMVERQGKHLRLSAQGLNFLEGKPLEQLHNGATVTYLFSVHLAADRAPLVHLQERYIVSFDLWEERFSIVKAGSPRRSASHLTAAAAEGWCLENLQLPLPSPPGEKSFVIDLECAVVENETDSDTENAGSLTLAALIDVLSRRQRDALPRWRISSGPLRLADLKDVESPKNSSPNLRKQ